jgi:RNA polymerase sigma-70 factor (ECF subfamily)
MMVPLSEQDPAQWDSRLLAEGRAFLARALATRVVTPRTLQALIHGEWCARRSLRDPAPWPAVLAIYDALLLIRDDPIVRLNRAVALAEVAGPAVALEEVDALDTPALAGFLPYHAVRADLLARLGLSDAARSAYDAALAFDPEPAERRWLQERRALVAQIG